uniref:GTP 3',8-cyclase n=1 Tax=Candidatus Kentrum sp. TC TaxID=2126339 RepID=A0A451ABB5_9GAMM|nr:MAG: cyclic pyranopterin phosphate synthase [Candidatus Kentron sp. TC]
MRDRLERPLKDLRISVTDRCNFRCLHCMPNENTYRFLPHEKLLTFEEIATIARIACDLGVNKLRITGGEPLLRKDLPTLIEKLASITTTGTGIESIAMTTNGYFLAEKARSLKDAGLDRITISLNARDKDMLAKMNGGFFEHKRIFNAIDLAADIGFPIKINTVIRKGLNEGEIIPLVEYAREKGHIIRFIEYMDVGTLNDWTMEDVFPSRATVASIGDVYPCEPMQPNYQGEVASRYRFLDGKGEFGVISSVTAPFCRDCVRARLSVTGTLYTCLFSDRGYELKPLFQKSDPESKLARAIEGIWTSRMDRYSEIRSRTRLAGDGKVEMYAIGG